MATGGRAPVYVRIKPLGKGKTGTSEVRGSLQHHDEANFSINDKPFTFPRAVLGDSVEQEAAYAHSGMDSYVSDFLDGIDVNVLAYGQTGSGKTHTTFGPPGLMERAGSGAFGTQIVPEYGLFPRALYSVIDRVQDMRSTGRKLLLTASCVELSYGMNMDMLFGKMPAFTNMQLKPARLFGQTEVALGSRDDALGLFAALATRNSRATLMNDSSSRSHCFVTLTLLDATEGENTIRESRLQFVDMAGSERLLDAHGKILGYDALANGQNMGYAEGMATNYSLMMLSQCIRDVARQKDPKQMSFRAYKIDLVFLLQASLMGSARTILFVCLHQSAECDSQSYNACDFGLHFATIRIKPVRRAPRQVSELRRQYEAEQKEAEAALARGCVGKDPRSYTDIKDIRSAQVRNAKQCIKWLNAVAEAGASGGGGGASSSRALERGDGDGDRDGVAAGGDAADTAPTRAGRQERYRFGGDSLFAYRLNGVWDEQGAAEQRFGLDTTDWAKEAAKSVEAYRKEFTEGMQQLVAHSKTNRRYNDKQTVAEYEIDGGRLGGDNTQLRVLVHTPKTGKGAVGRPKGGLVYFHGGGTIVGSAHEYSRNGVCPRLACDSNLVVVNVDYRLAPDSKIPAGITDGMCAIRWALAHAVDLGIDATRLAVGGESGGGYIAVGACMELAKCGEAERVALLVAISPQTSNFFRRATPVELERLSPHGLRLDLYKKMFDMIGEMMLGGGSGGGASAAPRGGKLKAHDEDPLLYPNLMGDAVAAAMPRTVVFTSEFDMLRVAAEELAEKLEGHGRLLDYVCHPSCTHCWWMQMDHKRSPSFWSDLAKVFARWL